MSNFVFSFVRQAFLTFAEHNVMMTMLRFCFDGSYMLMSSGTYVAYSMMRFVLNSCLAVEFEYSRNSAIIAGKNLANFLATKPYGDKKIYLVGYSLGGELMLSCLKHLKDLGCYDVID